MNVFTEVYEKSRTTLQTQTLDASWKKIEDKLKLLLAPDGPSSANATVLDDLRKQLDDASRGKWRKDSAIAEEIARASKTSTAGFQDRAALIKCLVHFYRIQSKGSQTIWVVDHPKAYGKWTFDEFRGNTEKELKARLSKASEVFGADNRGMMSDAHQMARKWAADVEVALGGKEEKVLKLVRRWFHETDNANVDASVTKLSDGFRKIHAACNSNQVIFSDRPHLRASGEWDDVYASVNSADAMPVIYIYRVFLRTGRKSFFGNIPKMWLCALTVIHELTHKLVQTKDIRYDDDGLKPSASFRSADALNNADSWAYFAADVVGVLSQGTIKRVLV